MTIRDNIRAIKAKIKAEVESGGDTPTATEVREKAIAVILGGSAEWIAYMRVFAETPAQLARLIPTDGTESDEGMRRARAYLVANGPCNPDTHDNLELNVGDVLDEGL